MKLLNGLNVDALKDFAARILANPAEGKAEYAVKTTWGGQVRATTRPEPFVLGGKVHERPFEIAADEPPQLLGSNHGPNPQELLFAALNSCMMVVFVAQASLRGITLESLEIHTAGTLDLRGFVDPTTGVIPGFDQLSFDITVRGNGTQQQFDEILEAIGNSSPNYFNVTHAIKLTGCVHKL
jgi:uncharacterized OsmC-like protein